MKKMMMILIAVVSLSITNANGQGRSVNTLPVASQVNAVTYFVGLQDSLHSHTHYWTNSKVYSAGLLLDYIQSNISAVGDSVFAEVSVYDDLGDTSFFTAAGISTNSVTPVVSVGDLDGSQSGAQVNVGVTADTIGLNAGYVRTNGTMTYRSVPYVNDSSQMSALSVDFYNYSSGYGAAHTQVTAGYFLSENGLGYTGYYEFPNMTGNRHWHGENRSGTLADSARVDSEIAAIDGVIDVSNSDGSITISGTPSVNPVVSVNMAHANTWTAEQTFSVVYAATEVVLGPGANIGIGNVTGSDIGNGAASKIGFWGTTPVSQPSGDILTALAASGIVASPSISASDITGLGAIGNVYTNDTSGVTGAGVVFMYNDILSASNTTVVLHGYLDASVVSGVTLTYIVSYTDVFSATQTITLIGGVSGAADDNGETTFKAKGGTAIGVYVSKPTGTATYVCGVVMNWH